MNRKGSYILAITFLLLLPSLVKAQAKSPLDDETLNRLFLTYLKSYQIEPGKSHTFTLFGPAKDPGGPWELIDANVVWSVEPQNGAHIDSVTGEFTVSQSTPPGSVFEVKANVENGRRILAIKVYIYTSESHPLVRGWTERAQIMCGSGERLPSTTPIQELVIWADGTFSVTWHPLETYRDYWGTYSYDMRKGKIKFTAEAGDNIPPDLDGEGYFTLTKKGELILKGIWLGSRKEEIKPNICGMVFTEYDGR